jgi:hypothetical protein
MCSGALLGAPIHPLFLVNMGRFKIMPPRPMVLGDRRLGRRRIGFRFKERGFVFWLGLGQDGQSLMLQRPSVALTRVWGVFNAA